MMENLTKICQDKHAFLSKVQKKKRVQQNKKLEEIQQNLVIDFINETSKMECAWDIEMIVGRLWRCQKRQGFDKIMHENIQKQIRLTKKMKKDEYLRANIMGQTLKSIFQNHVQVHNRVFLSLIYGIHHKRQRLQKVQKIISLSILRLSFRQLQLCGWNEVGQKSMDHQLIRQISISEIQPIQEQLSIFQQDSYIPASFHIGYDKNQPISTNQIKQKPILIERPNQQKQKIQQGILKTLDKSEKKSVNQQYLDSLREKKSSLKAEMQILIEKLSEMQQKQKVIHNSQNFPLQEMADSRQQEQIDNIHQILCQKYIKKVNQLEQIVEQCRQIFKQLELGGPLIRQLHSILFQAENQSFSMEF